MRDLQDRVDEFMNEKYGMNYKRRRAFIRAYPKVPVCRKHDFGLDQVEETIDSLNLYSISQLESIFRDNPKATTEDLIRHSDLLVEV